MRGGSPGPPGLEGGPGAGGAEGPGWGALARPSLTLGDTAWLPHTPERQHRARPGTRVSPSPPGGRETSGSLEGRHRTADRQPGPGPGAHRPRSGPPRGSAPTPTAKPAPQKRPRPPADGVGQGAGPLALRRSARRPPEPGGEREASFCLGQPWAPTLDKPVPSRPPGPPRASRPAWVRGLGGAACSHEEVGEQGSRAAQAPPRPCLVPRRHLIDLTLREAQTGARVRAAGSHLAGRGGYPGRGGYGTGADLLRFRNVPTKAGGPLCLGSTPAVGRKSVPTVSRSGSPPDSGAPHRGLTHPTRSAEAPLCGVLVPPFSSPSEPPPPLPLPGSEGSPRGLTG